MTITECVSTQPAGDDIDFTVLDERSDMHTLRIRNAVFRAMVTNAISNRAISKKDFGIELSNAASYLTSGSKR